jgi:hypothetical protein
MFRKELVPMSPIPVSQMTGVYAGAIKPKILRLQVLFGNRINGSQERK